MAYSKINWQNGSTPLNETNLNKMDGEIEKSSGKLETADGTEFFFDVQDGVYGWNSDSERGADTFHPFRSGGGAEPVQIRTSSTWDAVNSTLTISGDFSDKHYAIIEMKYAASSVQTTSAVEKGTTSYICAPQNISSTAQGYVASRSVSLEDNKLTINTPTWNNYGLLRNIWVI